MGKIEFATPDQDPKFLELHFRTNQGGAGDISNDARKLLEMLEAGQTHQHVHVVGTLPVAEMKKDPELMAALMGDHYRRSNLVAEMISIVEESGAIYSRSGKQKGADGNAIQVTYFNNLSRDRLAGVTRYFQDVGEGRTPAIGARFKMGWSGFRGSDVYDKPGLFGYEIRAVNPDSDRKLFAEFLNTIQWAMETGNWGLEPKKMSEWLQSARKAKGSKLSVQDALAQQWYDTLPNRTDEKVKIDVPARFAPLFASPQASAAKAEIDSLLPFHEEIQMLFHDWSRDPALFDDPTFLTALAEHQRLAIQALIEDVAKPERDPTEVVKNFLVKSGLYERMARSIGRPNAAP